MNTEQIKKQIEAIKDATREACKTRESAIKFLTDAGIIPTPPVREVKSAEGFHNEFIICPNCKEINHAKVLHTIPFGTYIHDCSKCGYTIMESEWDKLPYQKELEDYIKKYYPQLCTPQPTPHKEGYSMEDMQSVGGFAFILGINDTPPLEAEKKTIEYINQLKK